MTLEEVCNKIQRPINSIIQSECRTKIRSIEVGLRILIENQKIELLDNARLEVATELGAMVKQCYRIYDVVDEWQDSWNFMWGGGLMEVLTPDEKSQYLKFPYETVDYDQYKQQPDFYDKELPHLSFIINEMILLKYASELDNLESWYTERKKKSRIGLSDEKVDDRFSSSKLTKSDKPFEEKFDDVQMELLTNCINEAHLFKISITADILNKFFACKLDTPLHSENNRRIAYFFYSLKIRNYITEEWKAVIENNNLILAPEKEGYLKSSNLSSAQENPPRNHEIIDKYINQLKRH